MESVALVVEQDRVCRKCQIRQPMGEFYTNGKGGQVWRCKKCVNAQQASRRAGVPRKDAPLTPEAKRVQQLAWRYGITVEQWDLMFAAQNGLCAACHQAPTGRYRLAVDHCHVTGRVRALVCSGCNIKLGAFDSFRAQAEAFLARYGQGNPLLGYDD